MAEAKAHLRIYHSDDDTFISTLITTARRMIEQRYDLCLMQQNWSLFLDDWPEGGIFDVPLQPLSSVVDIKTYGDDDTPSTIDPAHYFLDLASLPQRIVLRRGRVFQTPGRRVNGIEAKLVMGFGATANAVPAEIKQAMLIAIADGFANRGDEKTGRLPLGSVELLKPYRTMRLT
ncbi:MAG: head-tail connector protein [Alphaproteobacteria bacterium]|nr:head-tail connector protein [Alphaproteobacteria bacterium]